MFFFYLMFNFNSKLVLFLSWNNIVYDINMSLTIHDKGEGVLFKTPLIMNTHSARSAVMWPLRAHSGYVWSPALNPDRGSLHRLAVLQKNEPHVDFNQRHVVTSPAAMMLLKFLTPSPPGPDKSASELEKQRTTFLPPRRGFSAWRWWVEAEQDAASSFSFFFISSSSGDEFFLPCINRL